MSEITDFIPTRASLLKNKSNQSYEEVTYTSHKPKKKVEGTKKEEKIDVSNEQKEFNVRQVKNEILKFGISGFDSVKKEEAKVQLAIKLGAKPPKNKYKNYKELLKDKKKEKQQKESEEKLLQLGKNSVGKSTAKGKSFDKKRRKDGILDIYGKVVRATSTRGNKNVPKKK